MTVDGILTDILDVTDGKVQAALRTSVQELTGDWMFQEEDYLSGKRTMPPTQVLGQAAYELGAIVGLKYRSSKDLAGASGIVVFSDRLALGRSYLEVYNKPGGVLQQRLP